MDYIKHFFGCTECAIHFQEMAIDKDMWNVSTKDQAILWLWKAHNIVSDRLSGDSTEDPIFPKIKFPSYTACPQCRVGFNFSEHEVLTFLKKIHSDESINSFGIKSIDENIAPQSSAHYYNNGNNTVPENLSSVVVIGFCVCILFIVALMFIPRKKRVHRRASTSSSV